MTHKNVVQLWIRNSNLVLDIYPKLRTQDIGEYARIEKKVCHKKIGIGAGNKVLNFPTLRIQCLF